MSLPVGKSLLGGQHQHLVRPGLRGRAVAATVTHEKGEGRGNRAAERVPHVTGQRHRGRAARLGLVGVAQQPQDNGQIAQTAYDANGAVLTAKQPDGKAVKFTYDADGNLLSLTPVSQPAHAFTMNLLGLMESYLPPLVGGQIFETIYEYNRDRQLTRINTPDGTQINFLYGAGGLLGTIATPEGNFSHSYIAGGRLAQVTSPQGVQSTISYAAELMTSQATTFDTYSVQVTYGYEFQKVKSINIEGVTGLPASVAYTFDDDDLVVQAGAMSIVRDPSSGYVSSKALGAVVEQYAYEPSFGELSAIQAVAPVAGISQAIFTEALTRDALGRILAKTETLPTGVTTYGYTYDNLGRLTDVTMNGVLARHYGYDGNHNRILWQEGTRTLRGTYDEQDRIVKYGGKMYAYTGSGDRMLRTLSNGLTTDYIDDSFGSLVHVTKQSKDAQGQLRTQVFEYINDGRRGEHHITQRSGHAAGDRRCWGDTALTDICLSQRRSVRFWHRHPIHSSR